MGDPVVNLLQSLSADTQDALWLIVLLSPAALVGVIVVRGYRPFSLVGALLWRFRWTNVMFVALIAVSVGIGIGLLSQERGLRRGSARAAEKFDLIVAAPGSEITMLFAAVYLQPSDVPLLGGDIYHEIATNKHVDLAAPIAFGDSYAGAPIIGTTAQFIAHLSGELAEGRMFAAEQEAVAGAKVALPLGSEYEPDHGIGDAVEEHAHEGHHSIIVGRMRETGSPWDKAILVPVEAVWEIHGLANGHAPARIDQIGPPFDKDYFPGTPAILVRAKQLWANYALRSQFTRDDAMAFFPGAVLSRLHGLMGDIRQVMSIMAVITQVLVTAGVLTGLAVVIRLFARRLALLRALGAPGRFVFAVVWCYGAALIAAGALAGLGVGWVAVRIISDVVSAKTDILVTASLGWPEFHLLAGFVSLTILLAVAPAFLALRRPVVTDLRN